MVSCHKQILFVNNENDIIQLLFMLHNILIVDCSFGIVK